MNVMSKLLGNPSPFSQLFDHLDKVMQCVDLVEPIINASIEGNAEEVKRIGQEIFKIEHEADEIKNTLRDNLPRDLMMAVSRPDFLAFLREQDSLADKAEDLAMMLSIRKLRLPEDCESGPCTESLRKLASRSVQAARQVANMTHRLDDFKQAGFKGPIAEEIREAATEVGRLEYKADKHQFRLVRSLLSKNEEEWQFVESYTWMQVITALGKLADHSEKMSDYLRLMIAE